MTSAKIPETSMTRYITGISALNIPAPEDTSGDWHFDPAFFEIDGHKPVIDLAGEGETINTNKLYGSYGIHECRQVLEERGVDVSEHTKIYSANHFRAILDMVYRYVFVWHQYPYAIELEDWLDTEEEKKAILKKAQEMAIVLAPEDKEKLTAWIEKQRLPGYKS
jgi:hypothetical protein